MTLSDVTSALSAAAPYSGAITATMNAVTEGMKLLGPVIEPDLATKTLNEYKDRLSEQRAIFMSPDSVSRAQRLAAYFDELCLAAEYPVGSLSGVEIPVPVEVLQSLGLIAAGKIKDDDQLLAIANKVKSGA